VNRDCSIRAAQKGGYFILGRKLDMEHMIQIFENQEFGKIRVVEKGGQPWFVGKEIADMLGYGNYRQALKTNVDEDDKGVHSMDTPGGKQQTTIINESGLYCLILSSKLPAAKIFKRWVTSEVLPSLRQRGAYITADTLERMRGDRDFTDRLLLHLSEGQGKNPALVEHVERLQSKAGYYDTILQSPYAVPVTIIAKDYGMSAIAFNRLLHSLRVQFRVQKTWVLYAEYADQGYVLSKTYYIGDETLSVHTAWTQAGRRFLYARLKERGFLPYAERTGREQLRLC